MDLADLLVTAREAAVLWSHSTTPDSCQCLCLSFPTTAQATRQHRCVCRNRSRMAMPPSNGTYSRHRLRQFQPDPFPGNAKENSRRLAMFSVSLADATTLWLLLVSGKV
jgi:hypothetical protein